ncbi:glutathione peroxidase [Pedobacter sp. SYP-B3415]|uniref:glutathione peroxidase n=1 Tax=Pedobacter sp. SYP-B3415 TaxID=2496641 RepID=UPI00101E02AE|nr:glutathione peroxidase [Pedobacter sp. SYP-B3415]
MDKKETIYRFKVRRTDGKEVPLSLYKDKVLLIVNTASQCGFTPQLKELQELRDHFGGMDFEILGFPTNDFGRQEPLDGNAIQSFCEVNFGVKFPVFDKIMIRGAQAHPLYEFLANKKLNGVLTSTPRWNFHKYLINKRGEVSDYFFPFTKPGSSKIKKRIQKLLAEDKNT